MNRTHNNPEKKKKVLVFLLLLSAVVVFSAPDKRSIDPVKSKPSSTGGKSFGEGSRVLNFGMGLGGPRYYAYSRGNGHSYRRTPAFSISYEQALAKKAGPGYLGIGAYLGFSRATYQYDNYFFKEERYYYRHSWTYWQLAARLTYHPDALNWEQGEIYLGLMAGLRINNYSYSTNSPDPDRDYYRASHGGVSPAWSLLVGGRYYFTEKLAGFAEIGYGISYLTLGLSLKI